MTHKLPTGYSLPLRSREQIAQYLVYGKDVPAYSTRRPRAEMHEMGLFCFDVKVYDLDTSFENLFSLYAANGHGTPEDYWSDKRWQEQARAAYEEITDGYYHGEYALTEIGIEEARETVNDQDTWKCLWWFGKDAYIDATYDFVGRSGGWLRLTNWCAMHPTDYSRRWDFTQEDQDYWYAVIRGNPNRSGTKAYEGWEYEYGESMDWYEVKKLYATVRMLEWDFQRGHVREYVEDAACFRLFSSYLEEIPDPRLIDWQRSEASCAALIGPRSGW